MSSKRGRKRNDNLPPNRARDVQRAFRARRAAHLQALEMRVSELEEENNCLRAALNLPPANRLPLGKGPTGKDKPKTLDNPSLSQPSSKSRDSSPIGESPSPRRSESASPSVIGGASIRTPPIIEGNNWEEGFIMGDQQPPAPQISSAPSVTYGMRPVPAPAVTQKSPQQFTFSTPMPPRPLATNNVPGHALQSSYTHTADRPIASGYNDMNYLLCTDVRENTHYSYHYQQPFSGESTISSQSPQLSVHSQPSHSAQRPHPQQSMPFPQRRPHTEPQAFRSLGSDLHLPSPPSHHISRLASSPPPAMHDVRSHYTSHGKHVNPLP
ncbi:hypothetical protein PAXRUDRAFT_825917 [Paxillus rubicundulus Ve08.2h10]|uniref:BZIP domain-containing protein n=1 Tax=Paxillus rubicundulus Ve08.2h10 TaxID=930991 RepID=A0A0D0E021_9AGAM|nr:hypothetical protein PAXRUDRAFT_825917 [Paxillus rubicundulus Ve08.2h10]